MKKVLVTGASGFVGTQLCPFLISQGYDVRAGMREKKTDWTICEQAVLGEITAATDWRKALEGVDVVVHLAGRAHVMRESTGDPLTLFRKVNVEGSRSLARQAAEAGVKRLIYLSSIKVNGERSTDHPLAADDPAAPEDAYGQSKWEAEQLLREITAEADMELVILRPVLVYGPGVKGNMQSLVGWIRKGLPLPLGRVENRRSLVSIENLLDFIAISLDHTGAAGEVFLVADGEDLSTPQLIRKLAQAIGVTPRLIPVPMMLLRLLGEVTGRSSAIDRLCGNLQVDISKNRRVLGWTPKVTVEAALKEMVRQSN
ncbi:MAG: SDR family oxidoreductase [Candidatus Thiodiazotropha sp. 6PLUC2]